MFSSDKKKLVWLGVAALAGVLLIIVGTFSGSGKKENVTVPDNSSDTMEYLERIENKIKNITEQITGASGAAVIVSADTGVEYVYVRDEKINGDDEQSEYITVKKSDGSGALVTLKVIYPEIKGVSVVCKGGDNAEIKVKIVNAVSTSLKIPSNRICVVGSK